MANVGIIETGRPDADVITIHGDFPQMFRTYFSETGKAKFTTLSVYEDGPLPDPQTYDAWIITGSPAAVYEEHPWLPPLRNFVRTAVKLSVPMLGVCFGHQLMAQSLGGTVAKSDKGRGIGVHPYTLTEAGKKLIPQLDTIHLLASHEDQVVKPPEGATVLATSAFCSYAMLSYGENALSIQPHPEFTPESERAIIHSWHERSPAPPDTLKAALDSLDAVAPDSQRLAPILWNVLTRQAAH